MLWGFLLSHLHQRNAVQAVPEAREIAAIVFLMHPAQFLCIVLSFLLKFLLPLTKTLSRCIFFMKMPPLRPILLVRGPCVLRGVEEGDLFLALTVKHPATCFPTGLMNALRISSCLPSLMRIFGRKLSLRPIDTCSSKVVPSLCIQVLSRLSVGLVC